MGRIFYECPGGRAIYTCNNCRIYLTNNENLLSKRFVGRTGNAFLFKTVKNVKYAEAERTEMSTGWHIIRKVSCKNCDEILGWMYEFAFQPNQIYKEGHVILEEKLIHFEVTGDTTTKNTTGSMDASSSSSSTVSASVARQLSAMSARYAPRIGGGEVSSSSSVSSSTSAEEEAAGRRRDFYRQHNYRFGGPSGGSGGIFRGGNPLGGEVRFGRRPLRFRGSR